MKNKIVVASIGAMLGGMLGKVRDDKEKCAVETPAKLYRHYWKEYIDTNAKNSGCTVDTYFGSKCYKQNDRGEMVYDDIGTANYINKGHDFALLKTQEYINDPIGDHTKFNAIMGMLLALLIIEQMTSEPSMGNDERPAAKTPKPCVVKQSLFSKVVVDEDIKIKQKYRCPITNKIMLHPVMASDGNNYEKSAILKHMRGGHYYSPVTKELLRKNCDNKWIVPNKSLQEEIESYLLKGSQQRLKMAPGSTHPSPS